MCSYRFRGSGGPPGPTRRRSHGARHVAFFSGAHPAPRDRIKPRTAAERPHNKSVSLAQHTEATGAPKTTKTPRAQPKQIRPRHRHVAPRRQPEPGSPLLRPRGELPPVPHGGHRLRPLGLHAHPPPGEQRHGAQRAPALPPHAPARAPPRRPPLRSPSLTTPPILPRRPPPRPPPPTSRSTASSATTWTALRRGRACWSAPATTRAASSAPSPRSTTGPRCWPRPRTWTPCPTSTTSAGPRPAPRSCRPPPTRRRLRLHRGARRGCGATWWL
ncbi:MAG: hypothetical protein J3K34DRAFT_86115 [Monoraphidium minutum]|nr:MAG: hypothetical protein J3K34DRAFT_86115 [Monoraphidium minutum]